MGKTAFEFSREEMLSDFIQFDGSFFDTHSEEEVCKIFGSFAELIGIAGEKRNECINEWKALKEEERKAFHMGIIKTYYYGLRIDQLAWEHQRFFDGKYEG